MIRLACSGLLGILFAATSLAAAPPKNQPPTVALTAPVNGASFTAPATITLAASASDSDGSIARVEFFQGSTFLGTASSAPYAIEWMDVPAGTYLLTAKAFDNAGASTTSATATVEVVASSNNLPAVSILAPAEGAEYEAPATIQLSATATDSDGTVAQVRFLSSAVQIGIANSQPYSMAWSDVGAGTYTLTAEATDDAGATSASSAVNITVLPANAAPLIVVTLPLSCTIVDESSSFELRADALDPDGEIATVQYLANGIVVGSSNAAPYTAVWSNPEPGTHSITAIATDNQGKSASSAPVPVTVPAQNASPIVALISPADQAAIPFGSKVVLEATASDPDGSIAQVEFYADSQQVGMVSTPPYRIEWSANSLGSRVLTARAVDNLGATATSSPINISVNPNIKPTVSITEPSNGAVIPPSTISISASASDADGRIRSVDYYLNYTSWIGSAVAPPYTILWSDPPLGIHTIMAVAVDDSMQSTDSAPISITVRDNEAPVVALISPEPDSSFAAPADIELHAAASDSDGTISKVEFFQDTNLIGVANSAPYVVTWNSVPSGAYAIRAVATDDIGESTASVGINITVSSPPAVALTAPAPGAQFSAPSAIALTASATDTDGSIDQVEFLNGSTVIATINTAPYAYSWPDVAEGSYTLFARARDNHGITTTSAGVDVSVSSNSPPAVVLTAPSAGAQFSAPASITLAASASDSDGSITSVDFLNGSSVIATVNEAPYSYIWTGVSAGDYTLYARARDDGGQVATSPGVNVTVSAAQPPSITILSPTQGANLAGDSVLVRGTFTGPPNSGIRVNDTIAAVDDLNQFYARVPLVAGSNSITVVLTTPAERIEQSITVDSDGVAPQSPVEIVADHLEGIAPYSSTFIIENVTSAGVSVQVNSYNPIAVPAGGTIEYDFTFPPGAHTVTIRATDAEDATTTREFVVVVRSADELDQSLQAIWGGLRDALAAGNRDLALTFLSQSARDRYGTVFDALMPMMPEIFSAGSPLLKGNLSSQIAEYAIVRLDNDGLRRVYLVYFRRGADGVWRLESM